MSVYSSALALAKRDLQVRDKQEELLKDLMVLLRDKREDYVVMTEAQTLLGTLSDMNTEKTLNFITGLINKVLSELFPGSQRIITLEKKLYRDVHPHINVSMVVEGGVVRDMSIQSGTGLRQVVSFLFAICLINIRKARPIIIMDELLSGVHPEAKVVMTKVIEMFSEKVQFMMVEYGMDDIGKMYLVTKIGETATARQIDSRFAQNISVTEEEAASDKTEVDEMAVAGFSN